MPTDTNEVNQEILQRITRVETKLDMMTNARDTAQEALLSSKSAHHRLDEAREEITQMKSTQKWLIGIFLSSASVAVAVVGMLIKMRVGA